MQLFGRADLASALTAFLQYIVSNRRDTFPLRFRRIRIGKGWSYRTLSRTLCESSAKVSGDAAGHQPTYEELHSPSPLPYLASVDRLRVAFAVTRGLSQICAMHDLVSPLDQCGKGGIILRERVRPNR
jgi:hypothetical protein